MFTHNITGRPNIYKRLTIIFSFLLVFISGYSQTTLTFNYTGSNQDFVVPPCVYSISVTASGGQGGGINGGSGAIIAAVINVVPGQVLRVIVGGMGTIGTNSGGFGGGGPGFNANTVANRSAGGGGASSISVSPYALSNRLIVAGGGGGMGGGTNDSNGGNAGGLNGFDGVTPFGVAGGGGTQTSGGSGGPGWFNGNAGTSGSLGLGAQGAQDLCYNRAPGGGGGGGYYGGGSGGADCFNGEPPYGGGGGGGGSSLIPAGGSYQGLRTGHGQVVITYNTSGSISPTFTSLGPYCQCAAPGVLPTTSNNGITGTWSPAAISVATTGTTTYTFTPNVGQCGIPATMNITVNPISVTMPANGGSTVACVAATNTAPTAPTVLDNCGTPLIVSAPVVSALPNCSGTRIYTYTYTACDGTTYPWVYTYTISAPTVTMPANGGSTVACVASTNTAPTAPTVLDNCGTPLIISAPVVSALPNCSGTRTYTYTYTACDGTTYPWVYTYTISAPTVTMPANGGSTVACVAATNTAPTAPTVLDNCGTPLIVSAPVVSALPNCSGTRTYTYTYTACDGTTYLWVYSYILNDSIQPTASNPISISVTSASLVPAPDPTVVTDEADNCTSNPIVEWLNDVSNGNVCNNEQITRTYSVSDACGNSILVTQLITITAVYPLVDAGIDQSICENDSLTLSAVFSPPSSVIVWIAPVLNGVGFIPPIGTNTYTVTANNNGCISSDVLVVEVNPLPLVSFTSDINMGCEPLDVLLTNTSASNGTMYNCVWTMGDGSTLNDCGNPNYTYSNYGIYTVGLTVTSEFGCTNSISYPNLIQVDENPVAEFTLSDNLLNNLLLETEIEFINQSIGAITYQWSFGDGELSTLDNPIHNFQSELETNYTIMLIAFSEFGCTDTAYQTLKVIEEMLFYVPNTFTPDGDALNNTFQPIFTSGYDPYNFTMLIFNRWGEIVYETHNANIGWDGTYKGSYVQDGTYTWKIEFKARTNDKKYLTIGNINVIR